MWSFRKKSLSEPGVVPALFLHIQKTAGTSIVQIASQYYGSSMTSHGDCWGHPPSDFEGTRFVSGHFGYDYARHLMPSRYSFTFLRDPMERVLSMYYFCREQNSSQFEIYRVARELDLEGFLRAGFKDPLVKKNIWNSQVWQLAHGYAHLDNRTISDFDGNELLTMALEHIDAFSFVGLTETFEEDKLVILNALNLPDESVVANRTSHRPFADEIDVNLRELIEELTELDSQLYQVALSRKK
ncbi:Sulfotransferase family protein [Mariprofundus ferrinatatus]|uniref:Sulfotransferase family protein n=1 Tax=Mariprofundus ferrinatatus TaxID=1921087 RepID=A0A2K8L598_9PROT|nr:sulfotransferase family 2 domain-containing protein [Mariprofundus ferrinatatus]ATX81419.1 Sulfotransferase family protein [Mariprofundus ferrinatatus]